MTCNETGSLKKRFILKEKENKHSITRGKNNENNLEKDNEKDWGKENENNLEKDIEKEKSITIENDPLQICFNTYLNLVESLPPAFLLSRIDALLHGYKNCALKGIMEVKFPPPHLKGDEFYEWSHWRNCTNILEVYKWDKKTFQEAAMKEYITTANDYLKIMSIY